MDGSAPGRGAITCKIKQSVLEAGAFSSPHRPSFKGITPKRSCWSHFPDSDSDNIAIKSLLAAVPSGDVRKRYFARVA